MNDKKEKVFGAWTFSYDLLAEHLKAYPVEGMRLNPWDASLNAWLARRDSSDQRVTRLPDDWQIIGFFVVVYWDKAVFRPFCLACGRNLLPSEISSERTGGRLGDQGVRLTCHRGHLLADHIVMHLD